MTRLPEGTPPTGPVPSVPPPPGSRTRAGVARAATVALVLLLLAGATVPCSAAPADAAATFDKANEAYRQGRFDEAADGYRRLVAGGVDDANAWYNLGNAYFRQDDLGRARACYERALRRSPRDADVRVNLATLRRKMADPEPDPSPPAALVRLFTMDQWLEATSILWFCTGLLVASWIRRRGDGAAFRAGAATVLLLVSAGLVLYKGYLEPAGRIAVVIPSEIRLQQGPGGDYETRGRLHAGTCVRVRRTEGDWREVDAPGSLAGWVHAQELETI